MVYFGHNKKHMIDWRYLLFIVLWRASSICQKIWALGVTILVCCLVALLKKSRVIMGASTKNSRVAVGVFCVSFLFILIAFVSPYWLVTDGELEKPKFLNLGLWEVCLNDFQDVHRFYDTRFTGCMWVFEEEYYIIHDYLLPGFYIATQFFFTLCFTLLLIAVLMTLVFLGCSRDDDRYVILLLANGSIQIWAALCGLISVIIFGARGDGRDWMPDWIHNNMGWAYALAVVGVVLLVPSGSLFMVEARRERYKRLNEIGTREASAYSADDGSRKYRGGHSTAGGVHTDI